MPLFLFQQGILIFIGCGVGFALYPSINPTGVASSIDIAHIHACFSPEGQCAKRIVSAIEGVTTSILVQSYSFTCPQIAQALG